MKRLFAQVSSVHTLVFDPISLYFPLALCLEFRYVICEKMSDRSLSHPLPPSVFSSSLVVVE